MAAKVLNFQTLEIIKRQVVPPTRVNDRMILLADWEHILETATFLGINVNADISRVNAEALVTKPNFKGIKILSLDRKREILAELGKHLDTNYLQDFEERLDYLKQILNVE